MVTKQSTPKQMVNVLVNARHGLCIKPGIIHSSKQIPWSTCMRIKFHLHVLTIVMTMLIHVLTNTCVLTIFSTWYTYSTLSYTRKHMNHTCTQQPHMHTLCTPPPAQCKSPAQQHQHNTNTATYLGHTSQQIHRRCHHPLGPLQRTFHSTCTRTTCHTRNTQRETVGGGAGGCGGVLWCT